MSVHKTFFALFVIAFIVVFAIVYALILEFGGGDPEEGYEVSLPAAAVTEEERGELLNLTAGDTLEVKLAQPLRVLDSQLPQPVIFQVQGLRVIPEVDREQAFGLRVLASYAPDFSNTRVFFRMVRLILVDDKGMAVREIDIDGWIQDESGARGLAARVDRSSERDGERALLLQSDVQATGVLIRTARF